MKNKFFWKILVIGTIAFLFSQIFYSGIPAKSIENGQTDYNIKNEYYTTLNPDAYINLTIEETWDLISNPANGVQILIDVRTPKEYFTERIYTQSLLEKPKLFPLQLMERNDLFLRFFMMRYNDKEIILYCRSANRSFLATQLLLDRGFNGKIYNMLGGINEWKAEGFPTTRGFFPLNF